MHGFLAQCGVGVPGYWDAAAYLNFFHDAITPFLHDLCGYVKIWPLGLTSCYGSDFELQNKRARQNDLQGSHFLCLNRLLFFL